MTSCLFELRALDCSRFWPACLSISLSPPGQNWLGVVWLILRLLLFFNKLKSSIFSAFGSFLPEIVTTTVDKNLQCIFLCCQSSEKIYCIIDVWRSSYYTFTLFNTKLILLKIALSWSTPKFKPNGARHLTQSRGLKTWPSQPFHIGAHECMLVEEYSILLTELCLLPTWLISIPQSATHLA